mgnify:CR=1 FL=1
MCSLTHCIKIMIKCALSAFLHWVYNFIEFWRGLFYMYTIRTFCVYTFICIQNIKATLDLLVNALMLSAYCILIILIMLLS